MTAAVALPDFHMHLNDKPTPFDMVSENLKALGSLSVADFLNGPRSMDDYWEQTRASGIYKADAGPLAVTGDEESNSNPILKLYETAQRVFGASDCLSFEFIELEPTAKQCILTITRSNGLSRSYRTEPIYSNKNEAKNAVSQMAVDKDALDFIISGDSEVVKAKKRLLAPLDPANQSSRNDIIRVPTEDDKEAEDIEACCAEWRAGRVRPYWVTFHDFRDTTRYGSALRINLTSNIFRTFSVEPAYDTPIQAKNTCARLAISRGILDFIRFGNGQTEPMQKNDPNLGSVPAIRRHKLSLQTYYETLPRPFPENFGDKPANGINAPGWLNALIQTAHGGGVRTNFYTISDPEVGVHGCILRLDSFDGCETYLLEPCISKRGDVRAAVCLFAASQGLGDHIRSIGRSVDTKMSPEIRRTAMKVQNVVTVECAQRHTGTRLRVFFDFTRAREAFGCDMRIEITSTNPNFENIIHTFSAAPRYRNKPDAKLGICYLGAHQGAVELMRFRGRDPPSTYVPFIPGSNAYVELLVSRRNEEERKRKLQGMKDGDREDFKKRKVDSPLDETDQGLDKLRSDALSSVKFKRDSSRSRDSASSPVTQGSGSTGNIRKTSSQQASGQGNNWPARFPTSPRRGTGPTITRFPPPQTPTQPPQFPTPQHVHNPALMPPPPPPIVTPGYPPMVHYAGHPPPHYYPHPPYQVPYGYPTPPGYPVHYAVQPPPIPHAPMYPVPAGYVPAPYGTPPPLHTGQFGPPLPQMNTLLSPSTATSSVPSTPTQMQTSLVPRSPQDSHSPQSYRSPPRRDNRSLSGRHGGGSRRSDYSRSGGDQWDHTSGHQQHQQGGPTKPERHDDVDALIKKATNYDDKQALADFCERQCLDKPLFFTRGGDAAVMVDTERFELPDKVDGESLESGEQRLAKDVLKKLVQRNQDVPRRQQR